MWIYYVYRMFTINKLLFQLFRWVFQMFTMHIKKLIVISSFQIDIFNVYVKLRNVYMVKNDGLLLYWITIVLTKKL